MAWDITTGGTGLSTSASNPAWYQAGLAQLLQDSQGVYDDPNNQWKNYDGTVVAPNNTYQTGAQSGLSALTTNMGPTNYATNMANYFNPYQTGVVDQVATLGARNLNENILPAVKDQFNGLGQFGSSRMMDFTNRAVRDSNESVLNTQAGLLNTGWNQANQAYLADTGMQLGGLQAINQVGNEQWGRDQQQNQFNLNQWNAQQQHPYQSMSWLSNVARGLQPGQVGGINFQTSSSTVPGSPNYLQTLGGLSALAGSAGR